MRLVSVNHVQEFLSVPVFDIFCQKTIVNIVCLENVEAFHKLCIRMYCAKLKDRNC